MVDHGMVHTKEAKNGLWCRRAWAAKVTYNSWPLVKKDKAWAVLCRTVKNGRREACPRK